MQKINEFEVARIQATISHYKPETKTIIAPKRDNLFNNCVI